jgi:aerobic carbon-monoxide dehydrogenase medium subunit
VKPAAFRYLRPDSLEEVLAALAEHGDEAKPLAGGQSLIPAMNFRLAQPAVLVDLELVADLRAMGHTDGALHVGAMVRQCDAERSAEVRTACPLLSEALPWIGHPQNRNRGTIGGSIVHADPASDLPAVLLALGARLVLRSPDGERELALAEVYVGPFMTALGPQELVTDVVVGVPPRGSGSAYASVEHPASGFALAGAGALVTPAGETVALTGVGATPFVLSEAGVSAAEVFGDRFASEEYRRELAGILAQRALAAARRRAKEDA